jgi:glutamine synthetase
MNREEAQKFCREHGVRYVLAQFVDIHGSAKAKAVPVEHLDMVLSD